jgi:hypothetical protein
VWRNPRGWVNERMAYQYEDRQGAESRTRPGRRRVVAVLLLLIVAGLVVVGGMLAWGARRLHTVVRLAAQTQEQYDGLNREMAFARPAQRTAAAPDAARIRAMLAVRSRLLASFPEDLRRRSNALLARAEPSRAGTIRGLLAAPDAELSAAVAAHLSALREQQMSPDEYGWLLGWAIRDAIDDPQGIGKPYQDLLRELPRVVESVGVQAKDLDTERVLAELRKAYKDQAPVGRELLGELRAGTPADRLIDMGFVAYSWLPPDQKRNVFKP